MDRIWPFLSLLPIGFGAWAPIYAGYWARRPLDGFASLEDLGAALNLGGSDVEALRGLVVFLPRRR